MGYAQIVLLFQAIGECTGQFHKRLPSDTPAFRKPDRHDFSQPGNSG
jgi:hypothetical protein